MSVGDFGDWEDQISPSDISLAAQKTRRKSIRRSMMVIPTSSDPPIGYSSPKIVVRRKSLGVALKDDCVSHISSTFVPRHSVSSLGEQDRERVNTHLEQPLILAPFSPPVPTGPVTASSPHSHVEGALFSGPSTKSPSHRSAQHSQYQKIPVLSDLKPIPNSIDALFESYERELSAWPRFLDRLEREASSPLQTPCIKLEEMMDNSMLSPFVEFISSDKSSSTVSELQRRTKHAYRSVIVGLVRTKLAYKKLKYWVAALERRNAALRHAKLKDLLPNLVLNPSPMNARDLLAFIPCLRESGEPSL
ncbi:hypothetical protein ECG_04480 [Echinococcus granulosus]|uniref:Uncharacterized protein n=1 Tax=Echinococcus granulosus TaxID=6210 RepID=U6IZJ3_ECHGR|nr:hypothetical protein EGR_00935 [Echinococcus granulosus]EUB64391.1 hypothetical protein EGR_00935 [Echinococcus granulosus]KAH9283912.1 hypothetical protein ECG_04480 [Echinococcus granulosus]CDS17235.1 hypothetical protein EgrG_000997150 [Echinococcus granulosus]